MLPFNTYPVRPSSFAASLGSTVVVAPHPDDEALGCGGLLALLRRAGRPVAAVLVSDGTMSHPASVRFPAAARAAVRAAEFRDALAILGVDVGPLLLGLPDGRVPTATHELGFANAVRQLQAFLQKHKAATVLVPWRRDPHPDHRATAQLVQGALATLPHPPRRLEYLVWAWERAAPDDLPAATDGVGGFRLDISSVGPQKQRAIAAHRSQVAPGVFTDDPDGFLLSEENDRKRPPAPPHRTAPRNLPARFARKTLTRCKDVYPRLLLNEAVAGCQDEKGWRLVLTSCSQHRSTTAASMRRYHWPGSVAASFAS